MGKSLLLGRCRLYIVGSRVRGEKEKESEVSTIPWTGKMRSKGVWQERTIDRGGDSGCALCIDAGCNGEHDGSKCEC